MFNKKDLEKIRQSIAAAEGRTSGEIVPMVVDSSRSYYLVYFIYAVIGWLTASAWLFFSSRQWGAAAPSLADVIITQALFISGFALLPFIPFIRRFSLPSRWIRANAHRAALSNFIAAGLLETRDRTGILIYISRFERVVEILADKGINDHIPDGYWQEQVDQIVKGIKKGKAAEYLCTAIESVGEKLAEKFPPRPDDTNELSDDVRFGHQDGQA